MALLHGIHHLTTLTADMDRLIGFYERVFDAKVSADLDEEGLRHAFIELGAGAALHPFEAAHLDVPQQYLPMFERGRIDHFGLTAADAESFAELRRRVMAEGAGDGLVTDMGAFLSFSFTDPDGLGLEVMYVRPEHASTEIRHRADWTYSDVL